MATARKTTKKTSDVVDKKIEVVEKTPVVVEETPKVSEKTPVKKQFKDDDKIPCLSITNGEYLYVGDKSGDLYSWLTDGDVVSVRYDDLMAAIRLRKPCIFKPRFVIRDDEIVEQNPVLKSLYDSLFTADDFRKIFTLSPNEIRRIVTGLPDGAKDSLKSMAISAIENGTLDSVQRIKVLDEIFGTDMLLKLTN